MHWSGLLSVPSAHSGLSLSGFVSADLIGFINEMCEFPLKVSSCHPQFGIMNTFNVSKTAHTHTYTHTLIIMQTLFSISIKYLHKCLIICCGCGTLVPDLIPLLVSVMQRWRYGTARLALFRCIGNNHHLHRWCALSIHEQYTRLSSKTHTHRAIRRGK